MIKNIAFTDRDGVSFIHALAFHLMLCGICQWRSSTASGDMTQRRADAVENRAKLLEAAEAIFLELGINTPLDAIAERAGVGRATLFRNFVDRQALILALLDRGLEQIESEAARLDGDVGALAHLLRFVADRIIFHAPLIEYWQALDHDSPEFLTALGRLVGVFEKPVERAVTDGACRSDLVPSDIILLTSMLSGALYARFPQRRRELADRAWALVVEMAHLRDAPSSSFHLAASME